MKARIGSLYLVVDRGFTWKKRAHTRVVAALGRFYAIHSMDRHDQRFVEVGIARQVMPLSDGEIGLVSGSSATFTQGDYAVLPHFNRSPGRLDFGAGRVWLSVSR